MVPSIAFFDMDRTLLKGDSDNLLVTYMIGTRRLGMAAFLKMARFCLLARLDRVSIEEWRRWVYREFGRFEAEELMRIVEEGYERRIMPRLYREGKESISTHKQKGHLTVIATAAWEFIAEKVRVQLGAADKISSIAGFENGHLSDEMRNLLPYNEGKKAMAELYAAERDVDLADCYLYTDSIADLPLLEAVGHAVVVNPGRGLRRLAVERGWQVLDWNTPAGFLEPSVAEQLSF
ncbi:MAG: HAD-IB family hydrolase [Actinobacteria bacterium]|nr:HAD-IB family hydrolase [Actinomycetota bacterium]